MNEGLCLHVSDFLQARTRLTGRLIAYDAMDGKLLFDTGKDKDEYIQQFYGGIVAVMWGGIVQRIFIVHNSWYEGECAE